MIHLLLGPSGSGKTTLGSCLSDMDIPELISTTTRAPRKGESECNPYHFVTLSEFKTIPMVESTEYSSNFYGTSKAEVNRVLSKGGSAFAIVDRHGADAFRMIYGDLVKVIYIYAPAAVLMARMVARGDNVKDALMRINHAKETGEFNNLYEADYCIVNVDLDASLRQLKAIVGED